MSEIVIYHNPRCSKSRQTLAVLQQQGIEPQIVEYLITPTSTETLTGILAMLKMEPQQLMRKGESIYKELKLKDATYNREQLIQIMCDNPKLIERPIVITNGKAKIGRPPESVLEIL